MVAKLRVVRPSRTESSATPDLFPEIATGQPEIKSSMGDVSSRIQEDNVSRPARALDDESQLLDVDQIYPASAEVSTRLSSALGVLFQATVRIERALDALRAGDSITADDQINHLLVVLQELFCFRDLGDGFGSVVSASISAVQNSGGRPLTDRQLVALNTVMRALRKKPYMTFETSMEVTERLEAEGLSIEPQGLDAIQDWLTGSGVR